MESLVSTFDPQPVDAPQVVAALADDVPAGPFLAAPALDDELAHEGWRVHAYLAPEDDRLVVLVTGS